MLGSMLQKRGICNCNEEKKKSVTWRNDIQGERMTFKVHAQTR